MVDVVGVADAAEAGAHTCDDRFRASCTTYHLSRSAEIRCQSVIELQTPWYYWVAKTRG